MMLYHRNYCDPPGPYALAKTEAAWRHFLACMKTLPPDQAQDFWQTAQARMPAFGGKADID
jgi:hypothetical protein